MVSTYMWKDVKLQSMGIKLLNKVSTVLLKVYGTLTLAVNNKIKDGCNGAANFMYASSLFPSFNIKSK